MIDYRDNNNYTVYIHIIPKSITKYDYDKYYVGITCYKNINQRWRKGNGYREGVFCRAIQKYGWDNIEHYIIASNLTEYEAKNMEKELIRQLHSHVNEKHGYNLTYGGDGISGYKHTESTKQKMSQTIREKMPYRKPNKDIVEVYQFTDLGVFIKKYDSIHEAILKVVGLEYSNSIPKAMYNKQLYAYGYIWRKKDDVLFLPDGNIIPINLQIKRSEKRVPVYQFDKNLNFIKRYNKISEISESVFNVINKIKTFNNCYYRYSYDVFLFNGVPHMIDEQNIKRNQLSKKYYIFNNDKQYIKTVDSIQEILLDVNLAASTVFSYIKEGRLIKNYYIKKINDIKFNDNNIPYMC